MNIETATPKRRRFGVVSGPLIVLILLFVAFSIFVEPFLYVSNLNNVVRQASMLALVAIGQCIVILLAGIDLSQGSVMGLTSVATALILARGVPLVPGIVLGLLVALACGLITGWLVSYVKVPPFVATFGMYGMALGIALVISGERVIWGFPPEIMVLQASHVLGIPAPVVILVVVYAFYYWLLRLTKFGTSLYAMGGNESAASLSGVPVLRNQMIAYGLSGLMAGTGGVMILARMNSARAIMGQGYEFEAIAAVILGGTNRLGGKGGVLQTLVGVFIIAIVRNGLNLLGINLYIQLIAIGCVLIFGYVFDSQREVVSAQLSSLRSRVFGRKVSNV